MIFREQSILNSILCILKFAIYEKNMENQILFFLKTCHFFYYLETLFGNEQLPEESREVFFLADSAWVFMNTTSGSIITCHHFKLWNIRIHFN